MSSKNKEKNNDDWFQKLDFPLKQVHSNYVKLDVKRRDIVNNQKLLNEFNVNRSKNKKIKLTKKDIQVNQFNEKALLNRFNIYNYKELDRDNLILKNLLSRIERSSINKNQKKLKKYKTNHEYDVSEISCNNKKQELKLDKEYILNNDEKNKLNLGGIHYTDKKDDDDGIINHKKPIKLNKIHLKHLKYKNSSETTPQHTDRTRNDKPFELSTENHNLINDITHSENYLSTDEPNKNNNIDIFESKNFINEITSTEKNETNNNNFFQTLTRVNQDGTKLKKRIKKNKLSKLQNLYQMMKIIYDGDQSCQKSGKIINNDLIQIKNKKVMHSINKTEHRKINLSINYSRIKTRKDIEEKILNNPELHIYEHLKNNIKINSQKKIMTQNYDDININPDEEKININNNKRKILILPLIHT
jgi:hypothetical protein